MQNMKLLMIIKQKKLYNSLHAYIKSLKTRMYKGFWTI